MKKTMIIIGAGIAGLSAGIHAQRKGFNTIILEQHSIPGGLCTSWKRGEYLIDGCIHWMFGSSLSSPLYKYWKEVGLSEDIPFIYHSILTQLETGTPENSKTFIIYSNADKLNSHLKELAPEDSEEIELFTNTIKEFSANPLEVLSQRSKEKKRKKYHSNEIKRFPIAFEKPIELMKMKDFMKMMKDMKPYFKTYNRLKDMSISDYSKRFSNPHLREAILNILGDLPHFSVIALFMLLSSQHSKEAGYPIGGSLNIAKIMEKTYLKEGGIINYNSKVAKIITKKNKAVAVKLKNKSKYDADFIISAADGYTTIYKFLSGRYTNRKIDRLYSQMPLFNPLFCLSLGVNRDFSNEPNISVKLLKKTITIENKTLKKIGIKHFCFDPTLAPPGKSIIQIMYASDYSYWKQWQDQPEKYKEEKKKIVQTLISGLEEIYPGISKDIEMIDSATPLTYERYTSNREGTYEGWLMTPKILNVRIKKQLPRLKNFYMVGQWVQPGGGLFPSLKSGRDVLEIISHKKNA